MGIVKFLLACLCMQFNAWGAHIEESIVKIEVLEGTEVIPYLKQLAELRISFYRDYPYLYEGSLIEEEKYLSLYADSKNSLFVIAKEGEKMVGAITGLPLLESQEENRIVFKHKQSIAEHIFHIGEFVLLPEYRNADIQKRLYRQFEKFVMELTEYDGISLCEIERPSYDSFVESLWKDNGFIKQPGLSSYYRWKEVDALEDTDHLMIYWIKNLRGE
ncbi:MAG: GNAT family N-acetyltransferase [Chlamydiota bacterium]